jgi:RHS repeat-associated protein
METTAGSDYYTADALGSTILITDGAGAAAATYTYDTWGNTNTATGALAATNPWRYATGYTDTSGLVKLGTRNYNPAIGRFTQQNPARQGDNLYIYAGDDPTIFNDPSERSSFGNFLAEVGGGLAGIAVGGTCTVLTEGAGIGFCAVAGTASGAFLADEVNEGNY